MRASLRITPCLNQERATSQRQVSHPSLPSLVYLLHAQFFANPSVSVFTHVHLFLRCPLQSIVHSLSLWRPISVDAIAQHLRVRDGEVSLYPCSLISVLVGVAGWRVISSSSNLFDSDSKGPRLKRRVSVSCRGCRVIFRLFCVKISSEGRIGVNTLRNSSIIGNSSRGNDFFLRLELKCV